MDIYNVLRGMFMFLAAHITVWYQLNLQFLNEWCDQNKWAMAIFGIPISYMYLYATKWSVVGFEGELWPSRLIGFAMGMVSFALLTYLHFNQAITIKTAVTLTLATAIVVIQIVWK